jgi:hypothetical protein
VVALALVLSFASGGEARAGTPQASSNNYSASEVQIGGNGNASNDCSGNYCAQESVGDTVVGGSGSSTYSAQFGSDTTNEPLLEVIVNGGNQNLGVLDPSTTATATFGVNVRSYLSDGYTVYITGSPPSQGSHTLTALNASCPCTSQTGAEQFGINLADNTSPNIGAIPVQVPSGSFSFGAATSDYNQADLFKYHDGDAIAGSDTSTGETDYTLSMILNISNVTPGGHYTGTFSAVVVPVY